MSEHLDLVGGLQSPNLQGHACSSFSVDVVVIGVEWMRRELTVVETQISETFWSRGMCWSRCVLEMYVLLHLKNRTSTGIQRVYVDGQLVFCLEELHRSGRSPSYASISHRLRSRLHRAAIYLLENRDLNRLELGKFSRPRSLRSIMTTCLSE